MTELIDNPPPLPEPDLYVHELLANKGGVFLGVKEKGICEQAHVDGETSKEVFAYFSSDQYRAGEAAAFARGVAAGRNAGLEVGVSVGDFTISPGIEEGRVWIARKSGEGGDFRIARLEEVIRKLYEENF